MSPHVMILVVGSTECLFTQRNWTTYQRERARTDICVHPRFLDCARLYDGMGGPYCHNLFAVARRRPTIREGLRSPAPGEEFRLVGVDGIAEELPSWSDDDCEWFDQRARRRARKKLKEET